MEKQLLIVGVFIMLVTVGLSGCTQQTVTQQVENKEPIIEECKYEFLDWMNSLKVYFTSYANDFDGEIVSYHWVISDGSTYDKQDFLHAFENSGIYSVTLTVTDDDGAEDSETIFVEII
jgi:hypothetical protein